MYEVLELQGLEVETEEDMQDGNAPHSVTITTTAPWSSMTLATVCR